MIIAIDGPAASGKGTLARRLAARWGLAYLDTGLLYRAAGLKVLRTGGDPAQADAAVAAAGAITAEDLVGDDLRGERAGEAASQVAAQPAVRAALLEFQRRFAADPPNGAKGAVLDGRDVGTVICPQADAKLFVTAAVDVRAERRWKELRDKGQTVIQQAVLQDLKRRDERDSSRAIAPLRPAEDAFILDTSGMDADAVFDAAVDFVRDRTGLA